VHTDQGEDIFCIAREHNNKNVRAMQRTFVVSRNSMTQNIHGIFFRNGLTTMILSVDDRSSNGTTFRERV
jgi:hypothetical protein